MTTASVNNGEDLVNAKILAELKKMNKVMTLVNGDKVESELAKFATTPERKKIWVLMDGTRDINELIKASGLKQAPVYKFITALENARLVERSRGQPPTRIVDYVPAEWTELIKTASAGEEERPVDGVAATEEPTKPGGDNNGQ